MRAEVDDRRVRVEARLEDLGRASQSSGPQHDDATITKVAPRTMRPMSASRTSSTRNAPASTPISWCVMASDRATATEGSITSTPLTSKPKAAA